MGYEPFYKTIPWEPYFFTKDDRYIDQSKECEVCGCIAECYLTNTYYCLQHGYKALRRDSIVHHMIKDANEKGNYETERLFQEQPDLHCHAKWIRIQEGIEIYTPQKGTTK